MITNELFDSELRGKITNLTSSLNWICIFIVATFYPFVEVAFAILLGKIYIFNNRKKLFFFKEAIGAYGFLIFGVDSAIFVVILYFLLPETKNKSYEEIYNHFNDEKSIFFLPFRKYSKKNLKKMKDSRVSPADIADNESIENGEVRS